ncbi:hypothetical protein FACS1894219_02260 [Clostridia bacterium]|nr:hypothetical protein FACS1894219_02260 [Clostridia bacterium]
MMIEQFTVEEINLMGVFDFAADRAELIAEIMTAAKEFDDPDMIDIGVSVLAKLYKMSDAEFDALELYPEYGDFDEDEDGDYYEQTEV